MKFRPCIDLHKGKVKQIVGSSYRDGETDSIVTNYETNLPPRHFSALYRQDSLAGGHVIMLGAGNEEAALDALGGYPGGMQVGGGILPQNAGRFLDAGASHVIVTSYVFSGGAIDWDNLRQMEQAVGKDRLVLDMSCTMVEQEYRVVTDRWQRVSQERVHGGLLEKLSAYCDEFLVHAAHVEGLRSGVDTGLIELLAMGSPIPVTYAGGIRSLEDLESVARAGRHRVDATVGSALDIFGGDLLYKDVVEWHLKNSRPLFPPQGDYL